MTYHNPDGSATDPKGWLDHWMKTDRVVREDLYNNIIVVTVWVGISDAMYRTDIRGGKHHGWARFAQTRDEAIANHEDAYRLLRDPLGRVV